MQAIRLTTVLAAVAVLAGCRVGAGHPPPSSKSVKKGELGNGGFTFRCDDSVACDRWNNADTFPSDVALGSTFDLQFLLREDSHGFTYLKDAERGTTIEPVGKFIKRGATNGGSFAAVEAGHATLSARDQKGWLVDYTTVRIAKPDSLVIYDSEYKGEDPPRVVTLTMKADERKSFRVVAQEKLRALAGFIPVEWTSQNADVVAVETYSRGKVTIVARTAGKTKLVAKGASLEQELDVEVTGTSTNEDGGTTDGGDAGREGGS